MENYYEKGWYTNAIYDWYRYYIYYTIKYVYNWKWQICYGMNIRSRKKIEKGNRKYNIEKTKKNWGLT